MHTKIVTILRYISDSYVKPIFFKLLFSSFSQKSTSRKCFVVPLICTFYLPFTFKFVECIFILFFYWKEWQVSDFLSKEIFQSVLIICETNYH